MLRDILVLAVLGKVLWDLSRSHLLTEPAFLGGALIFSFLLGVASRSEKSLIRDALTGLGLTGFILSLYFQGILPLYFWMVGALTIIYFFARVAKFSKFWIYGLIGLGLFYVAYLLTRH